MTRGRETITQKNTDKRAKEDARNKRSKLSINIDKCYAFHYRHSHSSFESRSREGVVYVRRPSPLTTKYPPAVGFGSIQRTTPI